MDAVALLFLFGASFAAASILPLSSEVPLVVVVRQSGTWVVPVLVATAGNVLGACTTYLLGRLAMRAAPQTLSAANAARWLRRYGSPALLLSWVPVVGDLLVLLSGTVQVHVGWFLLWTTAGKLARYLVVALAASRL